MSDIVEFSEHPQAAEVYMIAGWRQWADAGSISSSLPHYLIQETKARKIGTMSPDGYYLFQIPGTHGLVRPVVEFDDGFPKSLETQSNDFYYTENRGRGIVIFLGDEPHMDIERYINTIIAAAKTLNVKRIIGLGGVYGELPYDKERTISSIFSKPALKTELEDFAVTFSEYHGGASIGSYLCRRSADQDMEYVSFYAFVPTYDFSSFPQIGNSIRIENDFSAWLAVMRRINYMLKTNFDLSDLEEKSEELRRVIESKVDELENTAPQAGIRAYLQQLADDFEEVTFDPPLDDVWTEELNRLFDDDSDETA